MFRVLVTDDSPTARALLVELLRSDAAIEVVGEADSGVEAVRLAKLLKPDVITMDVRMPGIDGFEATRRIMTECPTPIVVVSSTIDLQDVTASMNAIRAGALTAIPKPSGPLAPDFEAQKARFLETVTSMAQVKVVGQRANRWSRQTPSPRAQPPVSAKVVTVAASTGGPAALARLLSDVAPDCPLPICVVQHMSPGFMSGLAAWLNTQSALPVRLAADKEPLRPGTVYLAPDDRHLAFGRDGDQYQLRVFDGERVDGFRPSATVLFESAAKIFGAQMIALILTGMGVDGVEGLKTVRLKGGRIVAQDQTTSVVYGMPGAAVAAGLPDEVVPIQSMAARVAAGLRRR